MSDNIKENKTHRVEIHLSEEEYQMLKKQQEFLMYPSAAQVIRKYIRTGYCYRFDMSGLYEFATQISHIGNNINQIAKIANETYSITPYQIESVKSRLDEIEEIVREASLQKWKIIKAKETENWSEDIDGDYQNYKNQMQHKSSN